MEELRCSEDEVMQEKLRLPDEGMNIEKDVDDFDYRAETKLVTSIPMSKQRKV